MAAATAAAGWYYDGVRDCCSAFVAAKRNALIAGVTALQQARRAGERLDQTDGPSPVVFLRASISRDQAEPASSNCTGARSSVVWRGRPLFGRRGWF